MRCLFDGKNQWEDSDLHTWLRILCCRLGSCHTEASSAAPVAGPSVCLLWQGEPCRPQNESPNDNETSMCLDYQPKILLLYSLKFWDKKLMDLTKVSKIRNILWNLTTDWNLNYEKENLIYNLQVKLWRIFWNYRHCVFDRRAV